MTAPGQEPDEVMTGKPAGDEDIHEDDAPREPDLNAIGDNHMPEDLRHSERARSERLDGPDDT